MPAPDDRCPACRYSLAGVDGSAAFRCPECGQAWTHAIVARANARARRWWIPALLMSVPQAVMLALATAWYLVDVMEYTALYYRAVLLALLYTLAAVPAAPLTFASWVTPVGRKRYGVRALVAGGVAIAVITLPVVILTGRLFGSVMAAI